MLVHSGLHVPAPCFTSVDSCTTLCSEARIIVDIVLHCDYDGTLAIAGSVTGTCSHDSTVRKNPQPDHFTNNKCSDGSSHLCGTDMRRRFVMLMRTVH